MKNENETKIVRQKSQELIKMEEKIKKYYEEKRRKNSPIADSSTPPPVPPRPNAPVLAEEAQLRARLYQIEKAVTSKSAADDLSELPTFKPSHSPRLFRSNPASRGIAQTLAGFKTSRKLTA